MRRSSRVDWIVSSWIARIGPPRSVHGGGVLRNCERTGPLQAPPACSDYFASSAFSSSAVAAMRS